MYRILFLEDDDLDVQLMHSVLKAANICFTSRHIRQESEFLDTVRDFRPHAILADYSLPMFNGMEAFRILKTEKLDIPFILITDVLSEELVLECLKERVDDFILKSSFANRLPDVISNLISDKERSAASVKQRMAAALKKSYEELQLLSALQRITRNEERQTIARDLHDELGQLLTALKIETTFLWKQLTSEKKPDGQTVDAGFVGIVRLVDRATGTVNSIASGLRSNVLDELGLLEAIKWQCQEFETIHSNRITCKAYLPSTPLDIDRTFALALFRVVQEALTNVARHARATQVEIHLRLNDKTLALILKDNGRGITRDEMTSSRSLGIIGLRERVRFLNGKFNITGEGGKGTSVSVTIPIPFRLKDEYAFEI